MSNRPKLPSNALASVNTGQQSLLNRRQITVGECFQIKGDAEHLKELNDTVEAMVQRKIEQAELKAQNIVQDAVLQAQEKAADIAKTAQATAQSLVEEATAQKDMITQQAYQEGFDAGFQHGTKEATDKVTVETVTLLQSANTLLEGAFEAKQFVLKHFQDDAMALLRHVTQRVLGHEMKTSPDTVLGMIEQAVDSLHLSGRVRVVVGQEILDTLRQFNGETAQAVERIKRFELVGDPHLGLQEIHVLSNEGAFSVGPMSQADRLLTPLTDNLPLDSNSLVVQDNEPSLEVETPVSADMESPLESAYVSFDELSFEHVSFDESDDPSADVTDEIRPFVFEDFDQADDLDMDDRDTLREEN